MIRRVKFENFKALRDVEISFDERLTVLVGPNGSGKSSVLQGIHILSLAVQDKKPHLVFSGSYALANLIGETRDSRLLLRADTLTPKGWVGFRVITPVEKGAAQVPLNGKLVWVEGSWVRLNGGEVIGAGDAQSAEPFSSDLKATTLIRLLAERLAAPSQAKSARPVLEPDGGGLASVLRSMLGNQPDRFGDLVRAFRRVIPTAEGIRFDLVEIPERSEEKQIYDRVLVDFRNARGVPASAVSDGTLYILGLLAVIFGFDSPKIILCDDLDHGLHPKAQMELIRVLRELMTEVPDLQIIATSHSLYVLSELPENSIRVLTLGPDGGVVCGRLSDHPDYEAWKEAMTPGEFWSHVGEDWLLKRKPVAVPQ